MFACRDATGLMTDEREGTLSGVQAAKYRFHMLVCPYCRTCRQQLDETVRLAKEGRTEGVSPELETRLLAALRSRTGK